MGCVERGRWGGGLGCVVVVVRRGEWAVRELLRASACPALHCTEPYFPTPTLLRTG